MVLFVPGFLEDTPGVRQDYGVSGYDERGVGDGGERVVYGDAVYVEAFLHGGLENVFEGGQVFGEVLGFGGGEDFEVCEANLREI